MELYFQKKPRENGVNKYQTIFQLPQKERKKIIDYSTTIMLAVMKKEK